MRISDWSSDVCSSDLASLESILQHIAQHEYDVAGIAEVEAFVHSHAYDKRVVRALLKLYQAFPASTNYDILAECLAKALLAPSTDLLSFRYLLPLGLAGKDERITSIFPLADLDWKSVALGKSVVVRG